MLIGGEQNHLPGDLAGGYYVKPTVFKGHNKMRVFQEEIFGPVVCVTTFKDEDEALAIANDTTLWPRRRHLEPRRQPLLPLRPRHSRPAECGPTATMLYPAHAAFGGYKQSGIGRENHKMMLDHYQQTKNMLVSYSPKKLGFF